MNAFEAHELKLNTLQAKFIEDKDSFSLEFYNGLKSYATELIRNKAFSNIDKNAEAEAVADDLFAKYLENFPRIPRGESFLKRLENAARRENRKEEEHRQSGPNVNLENFSGGETESMDTSAKKNPVTAFFLNDARLASPQEAFIYKMAMFTYLYGLVFQPLKITSKANQRIAMFEYYEKNGDVGKAIIKALKHNFRKTNKQPSIVNVADIPMWRILYETYLNVEELFEPNDKELFQESIFEAAGILFSYGIEEIDFDNCPDLNQVQMLFRDLVESEEYLKENWEFEDCADDIFTLRSKLLEKIELLPLLSKEPTKLNDSKFMLDYSLKGLTTQETQEVGDDYLDAAEIHDQMHRLKNATEELFVMGKQGVRHILKKFEENSDELVHAQLFIQLGRLGKDGVTAVPFIEKYIRDNRPNDTVPRQFALDNANRILEIIKRLSTETNSPN